MMKIPFSPPDITEQEIEEVANALRSGWITTGPRTKELERQVAAYCGTERAVCLNSQTACAEMALRLLGVGPGETTADGMFTIDALRCIGACGIAPAVTINGKVYPKMTVDMVAGVVDEYRSMGGAI